VDIVNKVDRNRAPGIDLRDIGYADGMTRQCPILWKRISGSKQLISAAREGQYAEDGEYVVYLAPTLAIVLPANIFDELVVPAV
jgi:hypothetical protein